MARISPEDLRAGANTGGRTLTVYRVTPAVGLLALGLQLAFIVFTQSASADTARATSEAAARPAASSGSGLSANPQPAHFKALLREYVDDIEPAIQSEAFGAWDAVAQQEVADLKAAALQAFSQGQYTDAVVKLGALVALSRTALHAREAAFTTALSAARRQSDADNYEPALVQITEALRIRPDSAAAARLYAKIQTLPQVVAYLRAARTAVAENNPEAELRALEEVVKRDPERRGVRDRVTTLRSARQDERYRRAITRGLRAVEHGALDAARQHLTAAQRLFSGRAETALLAEQLRAAERHDQVERLLETARAAVASDDWEAALNAYRQAEQRAAGSAPAVQGRKTADHIVSLLKAVDAHLAAAHRLSSPHVAAHVRTLVDESLRVGHVSPKLVARTAELQQVLERYSRPIAVRVISDGKTRVSVRGVGRVGSVVSKVIHLKPGDYRFEGRRSGYRSKIVPVRISPLTADVQVAVVCDEPI